MTGIYKITSPSGKVYVGQSININKRFRYYMNLNNSKKQRVLHSSFMKYGIDNHKLEIIEICDKDILNERERFFQEKFDVIKTGLNCRLTGTDDKSGSLSDETKLKISINRKGISPDFKDPVKRLERISKSLTGKKLTKEHRAALSKGQTGLKRSPEAIMKSVNSRIGRKESLDTRKMKSENQKGGNNSFAKLVINMETGIFYYTSKSAAFSVGMTYNSFNHYINGRTKRKLPFKYI